MLETRAATGPEKGKLECVLTIVGRGRSLGGLQSITSKISNKDSKGDAMRSEKGLTLFVDRGEKKRKRWERDGRKKLNTF